MRSAITRRQALGSFAAGIALASGVRPSFSASRKLNVLCHRVHQTCLTTGVAGDLTQPWREKNDAEITWTTFDTDALQDRLFREASLDQTDFSLGYLVNSRATPNVSRLLHPLNDYKTKDAIEDFQDIAPGLVAAMTINDKLIGIPVRHATIGLFYNEALLEERGIKAPPQSLEELVDQAKRLTFKTGDNRPVVGMVLASELSVFPVTFARAFGGDFISADMRVLPDPRAMEQALATLRDLFEAGALPRSYATTTNDDQVTWMQQGRAAFTVLPFARYAQFESPGSIEVSRTHQGDRISTLTVAARQDRDGPCYGVLGYEHPGQCARQGFGVERHTRFLKQGCDLGCSAQRQWTGACLDLQRSDLCVVSAFGRGRGKGVETRAGSSPGISGSRSGTGGFCRRSPARCDWAENSEGSRCRDGEADHAVDDRLNGTEQVGRAS